MATVFSIVGNLVERLKGSVQEDFAKTAPMLSPMERLIEAVYAYDVGKVRTIVAENAGVLSERNDKGETPLMQVGGIHAPEKMLDLLIDLGASLDDRDPNGRDVLGNAIATQRLDAATYYMNVKGRTPDFDDPAMLDAGRMASYDGSIDFGYAVAAKRPKL